MDYIYIYINKREGTFIIDTYTYITYLYFYMVVHTQVRYCPRWTVSDIKYKRTLAVTLQTTKRNLQARIEEARISFAAIPMSEANASRTGSKFKTSKRRRLRYQMMRDYGEWYDLLLVVICVQMILNDVLLHAKRICLSEVIFMFVFFIIWTSTFHVHIGVQLRRNI